MHTYINVTPLDHYKKNVLPNLRWSKLKPVYIDDRYGTCATQNNKLRLRTLDHRLRR